MVRSDYLTPAELLFYIHENYIEQITAELQDPNEISKIATAIDGSLFMLQDLVNGDLLDPYAWSGFILAYR